MARCGRCGLWSKTPADYKEQRYAGYCLWYQTRLEPEFEYDERDCNDFFERVPGQDAAWHFDYKVKRDNIGDAWRKAKSSDKKARIAVTISVVGLAWNVIKALF